MAKQARSGCAKFPHTGKRGKTKIKQKAFFWQK